MLLKKVTIKNFRLLRDVVIEFNESSTVIVGRNNSGKTSLAEIFKRLLADRVNFELEDFSLGCDTNFCAAYDALKAGQSVEDVRKLIPLIEVNLSVGYDKTATNLGPISDFIIDLNPDCTEILINFRYEVSPGGVTKLLEKVQNQAGSVEHQDFCRALKQRIAKHFVGAVFAVDPNDASNSRAMELANLRALIRGGFINAQRGLDDKTDRENVVLGKILELLFKAAQSENATKSDQDTAKKLETAVQGVQTDIKRDFSKQLDALLPAFKIFGYPRLPDPRLITETTLNVEALLSGHTRIHYTGTSSVSLPEAYNGLGTRNLIYILLKLLEFFKAHQATGTVGINVIFIEEPEAHLHPQMQEVFIAKLADLAKIFPKTYGDGKPWPVQFVVTTHSSHLANKVPFRNIRYFLSGPSAGHSQTKVKDLALGFSGSLKADEPFLHQYMTLTSCDLLFADKAILVEGTCERILLPKLIERSDADLKPECKLSSQYVSLLEIGGAYAHRFFKLLEFLELRSLVITDIDSINTGNDNKACLVSEGDATSNGCIKNWFPGVAFADLLIKTPADKLSGTRRIAYQIAETPGAPVGRSFEESLVLANTKKHKLDGMSGPDLEKAASKLAKDFGRKTDLALELAISDDAWNIPAYLKEGLRWLVEEEVLAEEAAAKLAAEAAKAAAARPPAMP